MTELAFQHMLGIDIERIDQSVCAYSIFRLEARLSPAMFRALKSMQRHETERETQTSDFYWT